jgi:hypothetical protein
MMPSVVVSGCSTSPAEKTLNAVELLKGCLLAPSTLAWAMRGVKDYLQAQ